MIISEDYLRLRKNTLEILREDREPFLLLWRDLADYILPKRYNHLYMDKSRISKTARNPHILDSSGTRAARILGAGMMNGITSPARPWFSLRIPGFTDVENSASQLWAEEVTRRMLTIMAETNFYNALAVMYLDLVVFGSAAMLIYEDDANVFRCYNQALGEYFLGQNYKMEVDTFAREFPMKVNQVVDQFGIEHVSDQTRRLYKEGGANLRRDVWINHVIEPNTDDKSSVAKKFPIRETYWEKTSTTNGGLVLRQGGFNEVPGVFPRYELTGNDSYGTGPGMDALGDIIQLQFMTKKKAQGLDKMISPPVVADIQLKYSPTALMPNGVTYVAGNNNQGIKAAYQINMPLGELSADINDIRVRIQEIFHNPLFNMISQLDTVRSATEIDARKEEKLVLLGSVLERFENEALDPATRRIFSIMTRAGLIPPPPPELQGKSIEIQYVSILSTAQRAVSAIPLERLFGLVGNIAGAVPQALKIPNWERSIRSYADKIGVELKDLNSPDEVAAMNAAEQQQLESQQSMVEGSTLVEGAKTLSETDVGGGSNALQQILGG